MDMTLSKRGDYVTRAAISLARAFDLGTPRKVREVVAETEVPPSFAAQILADLVRAGLATSRAGRVGGYRLARPPETISVLEVVEAGEGPLRSERCALGDGPCRWDAVCPLHETWTAATAGLRHLLSATTLADLAARDAAIEAGTYRVPSDSHRSHPGSVVVADSVQVELGPDDLGGALDALAGRMAELVPVRGGHLEAALLSSEDDAGHRVIEWRVSSSGRTTRVEAALEVTPVDTDRSEVGVTGTWHQHGEPEALLDGPGLAEEARRGLRVFLRSLARMAEQAVGEG